MYTESFNNVIDSLTQAGGFVADGARAMNRDFESAGFELPGKVLKNVAENTL